MRINVKFLHKDATLPVQAHGDDFGYDVRAVSVERIGFLTYRYHTGLAFQPLSDRRNLVAISARSRSSIWKKGMILANSIGTIDNGYTGEVTFVFFHIFPWKKKYKVGEKIGQIHLDIAPYMNFSVVDNFQATERGNGREGSSGE